MSYRALGIGLKLLQNGTEKLVRHVIEGCRPVEYICVVDRIEDEDEVVHALFVWLLF